MMWFKELVFVLLFVTLVTCSPMMYKINDQQKYEADLIPVSSTVIPVHSSYDADGKLSDQEYKRLYLKHVHKKVVTTPENPEKLITVKSLKKD